MSSSAARALRVLDQIANSSRPVGVTDLARALSLPPGTVFRSLDALLRAGLIARYRASTRYVTGPAAEQLQRTGLARFSVREVCLPYLRQLASVSGETVSLHVRLGSKEVRICSAPGTGEVMMLPSPGETHPLTESCAGQVMLAFMPDQLPGAPKQAPRLRAVLRIIRSRGFATNGRAQPAIAFPIRIDGTAIAAVAVHAYAATPAWPYLAECQEIMGKLETLASAQPALFGNPFDHLAPGAPSAACVWRGAPSHPE